MDGTEHIPPETTASPDVKRVNPEEWNPKLLRKLWILLWIICAMALGAEFFIHPHPHFEGTGFFGFNALLGFVACTVMIIVAKLLAFFLKRKPDYYGKDV